MPKDLLNVPKKQPKPTNIFVPLDALLLQDYNWLCFHPAGTSLWSSTWSRCVRSATRSSRWSWKSGWRSCPKLLHGSEPTVKQLKEMEPWGGWPMTPSPVAPHLQSALISSSLNWFSFARQVSSCINSVFIHSLVSLRFTLYVLYLIN